MKLKVLALLSLALFLTTATFAQTKKPLANDDVLQMVKAGFPESMIIKAFDANDTNFDVSVQALTDLKSGGVSQPVIEAMLATEARKKSPDLGAKPAKEPPADPKDPKSPHDPGIYWFSKSQSERPLVRLQPTSYSNSKTGGMFGAAMTGGLKKVNWKAVLPGPNAALRVNEFVPEFWFYFDEKPQGFQSSPLTAQASKPEDFGLAKMERGGKERSLVVGQGSAFGTSTGTRRQDEVAVEVQKVAPGIYKVTPTKPLELGEYCFVPPGGAVGFGMAGGQLFDFGIDH